MQRITPSPPTAPRGSTSEALIMPRNAGWESGYALLRFVDNRHGDGYSPARTEIARQNLAMQCRAPAIHWQPWNVVAGISMVTNQRLQFKERVYGSPPVRCSRAETGKQSVGATDDTNNVGAGMPQPPAKQGCYAEFEFADTLMTSSAITTATISASRALPTRPPSAPAQRALFKASH